MSKIKNQEKREEEKCVGKIKDRFIDLQNTIRFLKDNKKKFMLCILIEALFIFSLFYFILHFSENTEKHFQNVKDLIGKDYNDESTVNQLISRTEMIEYSKEMIKKEYSILLTKAILSFILFYGIIFGLILSTYIKKRIITFAIRFLGINIILISLLFLLFGIIVEIKTSATQGFIISEKSFISTIFFITVCWIMIFIMFFTTIISALQQKVNLLRKITEIILTQKMKLLKLFITYGIISSIILFIVIVSFLILVFVEGFIAFIIGLFFLILLFIPAMVVGKIYFYIKAERLFR